MDNKLFRHLHLLVAIEQHGTLERLAEVTGTNSKYLSQLKNRSRGMGDKFARKMEAALGLESGAWDLPPASLSGTSNNDIRIQILQLSFVLDESELKPVKEMLEVLAKSKSP